MISYRGGWDRASPPSNRRSVGMSFTLKRPPPFAPTVLLFFLWLALPQLLDADDSDAPGESPCRNAVVVSVPSRPTVTSATDTTQCGVVEMEYGLERQWPGGGANRDDLSGGLRLGLTPNLDFHWASATFLHIMNGNGNHTGFGD